MLNSPCAVCVSNGEVFFADANNHRVRKLLRNGQLVTICGTGTKGYNGDGQPATNAQLDAPSSVFVSSSDQVYISEDYGQRIRRIDRNGMISTIAGTGELGFNGDDRLAVSAMLNYPYGVFVTEDEEVIFCDFGNYRVRKIDRRGMIRTIAGTGDAGYNGDHRPAIEASINQPTSVFLYKNEMYISDFDNNRIRKVDQNGMITTIAGTGMESYNGDDIPATSANIYWPDTVFIRNDEVYVSDRLNNRVRKIDRHGMIRTIAGTGDAGYNGDGILAIHAQLHGPLGLFVDEQLQVFIADSVNNRVRKIDRNGIIWTVVGTGEEGFSGDVSFDFKKYPHIGPKRKLLIKPFPKACYDISIQCDSDA